jgi:DNA topoisomerase-2
MEHTNTTYTQLSFNQHVRLRTSMYLGSKTPTENTIWCMEEDRLVKKTLVYPLALYNIIDEIVLNVIDHFNRTSKIHGKNKCDTIKMSIDEEGTITCYNNGEGIIIERNEQDVYIPEMIFTKEMTGSNFENDSEAKIGMNGIGAKATNILSKSFSIKTVDSKSFQMYEQLIENGNEVIHEPTITKVKRSSIPFTEIKFQPDYEYFEYNDIQTISDLIRTRLHYVSAYMGKGYKVFFNEEKISVDTMETLAKLAIGESDMIVTYFRTEETKSKLIIANWDSEEHISMINGLYLSEGGTHIKCVIKHILGIIKPRLEKQLKGKLAVNSRLISNMMFIFYKGEMADLEYKNQSKSELSIPESRFKKYSIPSKDIAKIWEFIKAKVDTLYLSKITKETTVKKVSNLTGIKKYNPADYAGTSKSADCTLFIPEGDSAESCVRNGLSGNSDLGFKYNGLFNIQGVPLNARKEVDVRYINDTMVIDRKKKLNENERLMSLVKVLNLNWHFSYKDEEEFKTLRYGKVVIAVDADSDGIGNICSLILNFFNVFFPELIKRKYLSILNTPLVRAYPIKKVVNGKKLYIEEFYNSHDYNEFADANDLSLYKISYIKGLATHSNAEIRNMFKDMYSKIREFEYDEQTDLAFETYFGNDSDKRKDVLSRKVDYRTDDEILTCSNHLNTKTRDYQLENIQRKMPHVVDGLNPARRKVLAGSIMKFKQSNTKLKVFQLGGYIAEKMLYHHGSDSLNNTIITMAQCFNGARNIPVLLPLGQFGTHYKGGKDAGSPRYIDTKLNREVTDLLYPSKDMDILEYTLIDGEYGEPKYFIPILPTALLEDVLLPATGWKIEMWARDFKQVYDNTIRLINGQPIQKMGYFMNKFKGDYVTTEGGDYLVGRYTIRADDKSECVTITSLPPRVWVDNVVEYLQELPYTTRVRNSSTIDSVNIEVKMSNGSLDKIRSVSTEIDPVVKAFKIYTKVNHCINVYSEDDTVLEYSNYEEIMTKWFVIRKKCYMTRIEREIIILEHKLIVGENYIRFIENHVNHGLSSMTSKKAIAALESLGYAKLNKGVIDNAGRIPNEELPGEIKKGASFDYLLNLSYKQLNIDHKGKLLKRINEIKENLKVLKETDSYKKIWMAELAALKPVLENGFSNGFYKEDDSLFH